MNCRDTDHRQDTVIPSSHMWACDTRTMDQSGPRTPASDQWEPRELDTRSLWESEDQGQTVSGSDQSGQIICLVKTETKPHVMVHKYNLSKLHLHHQLWFHIGSSILKFNKVPNTIHLNHWVIWSYSLRLFLDAHNLEICSFYGPHIGIRLKTVWNDL